MELTQEQKELIEGLNKKNEALKSEIETVKETVKETQDKAAKVESLEAELKANKDELAALKEAGITQGNDITALKNSASASEQQFKSLKSEIKSQLEENKDILSAFKNHSSSTTGLSITAKAAGNMTTSNISPTTYSLSRDIVPGLIDILGVEPMIEDYCNTGSTNSSRIVYFEKKNRDGSTVFIAEAAEKTQIDFDIVESESAAKKVADIITISEEMMEDVDFISSAIANELRYQINLAASNGILSGDGTGANLSGITNVAPAYGLTTVLTATPNVYDCIRAAATQIRSNNGMATHVFLNPIDYTNMGISKGTTGYYVIIDGMVQMLPYQIVESNQITVGKILVGDMRKSIVRNYKPFTVDFGYNGDDWKYNRVTARGERRLHHYIPSNHTPCFVYDDISDIVTAITKP